METSSRPCTLGCRSTLTPTSAKLNWVLTRGLRPTPPPDARLETTGCVGNSIADSERCLLIFDRSDLRLLNHSRLAIGQ